MKMKKSLKELKEELDWYENTPWYIDRDGMPSIALIIFGIFTGFIGVLIYRFFKKENIREKINKIEV